MSTDFWIFAGWLFGVLIGLILIGYFQWDGLVGLGVFCWPVALPLALIALVIVQIPKAGLKLRQWQTERNYIKEPEFELYYRRWCGSTGFAFKRYEFEQALRSVNVYKMSHPCLVGTPKEKKK